MSVRHRRWKHAFWVIPVAGLCVILSADAWAAARGFYTRLTILSTIIRLSREVYVDPVDTDKLMDGAIDGVLDRLDPHSSYLPPKRAKRLEERLRGNFGGVGIRYTVIDRIPTVISTIQGGPAQRAGIVNGDRLVAVAGEPTVGWRTDKIQKTLRGRIGTKVRVSVARAGHKKPFEIEIVRGEIPLRSIPYTFMVNDSVGYIRITNFSSTTGREFALSLDSLAHLGMENLVLDLRNNGGGHMGSAVAVCDNLLSEGTAIVTQKGRWKYANQAFYATGRIRKSRVPIVVMINHGSASASEIVSGAIQDTDRGLITGQRSFGKGLVQRKFELDSRTRTKDSGVLLLTIARYFTPTGRLIQRDYSKGSASYYAEGLSDSATVDSSTVFRTPLGRRVYGGGGITPDHLTKPYGMNRVMAALTNRSVFFRFADHLIREGHRFPASLDQFRAGFRVDDELIMDFVEYVGGLDPSFDQGALKGLDSELSRHMAAGIAGRLWGVPAWYRMLTPHDTELKEAVGLIPSASNLMEQASGVTKEGESQ